MIALLITNIESDTENITVVRKIKENFPDLKLNFDVEHEKITSFPCQHNILRVEGLQISTTAIIKLVNNMGFDCEILADKICDKVNNNQ